MKKASFMGAVFLLVIAAGLPDPALAQTLTVQEIESKTRDPLVRARMYDFAHAEAADVCNTAGMNTLREAFERFHSRLLREIGPTSSEVWSLLQAVRQRKPRNCATAQGGAQPAGSEPSAATGDPLWFWGFSGGIGRGSVVDAVEKSCAKIKGDLNTDECEGTNRGPAWTIGGEVRRRFGRRGDVGVNLGVTNPRGFRKAFSGSFGTEMFRGTGFADLWLLDIAVAVGFSPNDRVRLYGRAGPSYFDVTRVSTFTFRNETDRVEENFSGFGVRTGVGLDVRAVNNFWVSVLGARTWTNDGDWDEKLSVVAVVGKVMFAIPSFPF